MSWKRALFLCGLVVVAIALGGCQPPLRPVVVGRRTPPLLTSLPVLQGAKNRPGGLNEMVTGTRPVVLAFFTPWCPVSKPALNALERVAAEYREGVSVAAVGMDAEMPELEQFLSSESLHFTIAADREGAIAKEMSVPTMPMIFVLDGKGFIRYAHAGYHGEEDDLALREEVVKLSRRAPPEPPAPELPDMPAAPTMPALEPPPDLALDVERLKARATTDLEDGLFVGAANLAGLATKKAPADAEAWLILGAANSALNDRDAARDAYKQCVTGAGGPRLSECVVLLATF